MKIDSAHLNVVSLEDVRRLPTSWPPADLRRVLALLAVDDCDEYPDSDLEEMITMALQDLDADDAMELILTNFTDGQFTKGQIQHLCTELKEDRAWEEYSDLADHRLLYDCIDLLSSAFPMDYSEPSARKIVATIQAEGIAELNSETPLSATTLLRGIAACMDANSVLNRLFEDQIAGGPFTEAGQIIWHIETETTDASTLTVTFWAETFWFRDLDDELGKTCSLKWTSA